MISTHILPLTRLTPAERALLRAAQRGCGEVWNECVARHRTARQTHQPWPSYGDLAHQLRRLSPDLCAQSNQATIRAFIGAVESTRQNRKEGRTQQHYPYRMPRYQPVRWPAQAIVHRAHGIELPLGGAGGARRCLTLVFPEHARVTSYQIVWQAGQYALHYQIEQSDTTPQTAIPLTPETHATCDLGEIHQAALTTDQGMGLLVSGRGIRSLKQGRHRQLADLTAKQARCLRHSRQWRKYQRAGDRLLRTTERRIRDLRHKGVRTAVNFLRSQGVTDLFVGNPDGVRRRDSGPHHNQRIAGWEYGLDLRYFAEACAKVQIRCQRGDERGTSSTCPVCGQRQKVKGRTWRCRNTACGFAGHRDLVGSLNMHPRAGWPKVTMPSRQHITYRRPGPLAIRIGTARRSPGDTRPPGTTFSRDVGQFPLHPAGGSALRASGPSGRTGSRAADGLRTKTARCCVHAPADPKPSPAGDGVSPYRHRQQAHSLAPVG